MQVLRAPSSAPANRAAAERAVPAHRANRIRGQLGGEPALATAIRATPGANTPGRGRRPVVGDQRLASVLLQELDQRRGDARGRARSSTSSSSISGTLGRCRAIARRSASNSASSPSALPLRAIVRRARPCALDARSSRCGPCSVIRARGRPPDALAQARRRTRPASRTGSVACRRAPGRRRARGVRRLRRTSRR